MTFKQTAGVFWLAGSVSLYAQGTLSPPGAPAPTMKTLEQIEPRVPIASLPFTINASGSYYVTSNLLGTANKNGISITADHVSLDLNGFLLQGVVNSRDGINLATGVKGVAIRNGTLRDWRWDGVDAQNAEGLTIRHIRAIRNGTTNQVAHAGIRAGADAIVESCVAKENFGWGILANHSTISGCTAEGNGGDGISAGTGCTVQNVTASFNGRAGISARSGVVKGCVTRYNQESGIKMDVGGTVTACFSEGNTENGILAVADSTILNNTCRGNGNNGAGAGVKTTGAGNRIDANLVTDNDQGLLIAAPGSLIAGNMASNNDTNFHIGVSNRHGPIVDITAAGTPAVIGNSGTGTLSSTHPFSNFAF